LIDGRTVYTPLYAGVFWEVQNVPLDAVDQIEVVSGPGGTVWGANAVNGVINIITRGAKDTLGLLLEGGGGTELHGFGAVRYGGQSSSGLAYRVASCSAASRSASPGLIVLIER
jgi:iron complex outermembrane receptor protein